MASRTTRFSRIVKGFYDIIATYVLVWALVITAVALLLHLGFSAVAQPLGHGSVGEMWGAVAQRWGVPSAWVRLAVYGGLQLLVFWLGRGVLGVLVRVIEWGVDRVQRLYQVVGQRLPSVQLYFGVAFTWLVTALLVPLVVQPTTVGFRMDRASWVERAANLLDGTAPLAVRESVVGLYRKLYAEPVVGDGIPREALDREFQNGTDDASGPLFTPKPGGKHPMMDRWNPIIWEVAGGDPHRFAQVKAFMWVESGGRQFAISHTGCMGLMQFCSGTAKNKTFRHIFGVGQVYSCHCAKTSCKVPRDVQRELERGDLARVKALADQVPCEVTDARFHPTRAIRAGHRYVEILSSSLGDNLSLMYVGYNSGPGLASRVYALAGKRRDLTIDEIEPHLADVLRPQYGTQAESRARGLLRTHLPKLQRAYKQYYAEGLQLKAAGGLRAQFIPPSTKQLPAPTPIPTPTPGTTPQVSHPAHLPPR